MCFRSGSSFGCSRKRLHGQGWNNLTLFSDQNPRNWPICGVVQTVFLECPIFQHSAMVELTMVTIFSTTAWVSTGDDFLGCWLWMAGSKQVGHFHWFFSRFSMGFFVSPESPQHFRCHSALHWLHSMVNVFVTSVPHGQGIIGSSSSESDILLPGCQRSSG